MDSRDTKSSVHAEQDSLPRKLMKPQLSNIQDYEKIELFRVSEQEAWKKWYALAVSYQEQQDKEWQKLVRLITRGGVSTVEELSSAVDIYEVNIYECLERLKGINTEIKRENRRKKRKPGKFGEVLETPFRIPELECLKEGTKVLENSRLDHINLCKNHLSLLQKSELANKYAFAAAWMIYRNFRIKKKKPFNTYGEL